MAENTQIFPAKLLLEDGRTFTGKSIGTKGTVTGEMCFNTGMTGYQEIFTDPSYYKQIMVMTNVHIGNYGILEEESESKKPSISALVCRNLSIKHSRQKAELSLVEWAEKHNLIILFDIDTRAIVRHIREKGAMNGIISNDILEDKKLKKILKKAPAMKGAELASEVTTEKVYITGPQDAEWHIAALDYGIKQNILRLLNQYGVKVTVFPARTSFEEIMKEEPDGIFLSNGPGDPAAMDYAVKMVKKAIDAEVPIYGICLGHQLIGRALGIKTFKLHHGHRGINHPVLNTRSGLCEVTSQNHGFGISANSARKVLKPEEITHLNLNDKSVEGLRLNDKPVMSVQYHPESAPGPHDSRYLFEEFLEMVKKYKKEHVS